MQKVIVELIVPADSTLEGALAGDGVTYEGFDLDTEYEPVPLSESGSLEALADETSADTTLVRGEVEEENIDELLAQPNVVGVWTDARIEAFDAPSLAEVNDFFERLGDEFAVVPMGDEEPGFNLEIASHAPRQIAHPRKPKERSPM